MTCRTRRTQKTVGIAFTLLASLFLGSVASSQESAELSLNGLTRMTPGQLEVLYRSAQAGQIPQHRVRGRALLRSGTRIGPILSRSAGVAWQGKVFAPNGETATNRFFGLKMIRGEVMPGPSWLDGGPSIILDYSRTSKIYARYRDEMREVAPGLWLGLMYDRSTPPQIKMYFAIQSR